MKITTHKIKRFWQRISIYLHKLSKPKEESYYTEREASSICNYLLKDPESEVLSSPLSGKYFLRNDKRGMFIVLDMYSINIINHVYGYKIDLSMKMHRIIEKRFLSEIDSRRIKMEEEYTGNIKHSLNYILKRLKDETISNDK